MSHTPTKTIFVNTDSPAGGSGKKSFDTGVLLNFNQEQKGGLTIELLMVMHKKDGRQFQRIPMTGNKYLPYLAGLPAAVGNVLKKMSDDALIEQLVRAGFGWLRDADKPFDHLDARHHAILRPYMSALLQELKPLAKSISYLYFLPRNEPFTNMNIRPAAFSAFTPKLAFKLEKRLGMLCLDCTITLGDQLYPVDDFQQVAYFLKSRNEFFLLTREDMETLDIWRQEWKSIPEMGMPRHMVEVIKPLSERYPVDASAVIRTERVVADPRSRVYVSELNENFLLIKPKWLYGDHEVEGEHEEETRVEMDQVIYEVVRRQEEERGVVEAIRRLHGKFGGQSNGYFYLNFKEALEKSWFLTFYRTMQEMDIPVLGMNKLRKFKYNTNTPTFEIVAGKSIDWFDLRIKVSYGELVVSLQDLRKAILGKQDYILLSDGSLGLLPREWIEQYSMLMRMGQMKEGGLQLPVVHWSLLEEAGAADADEVLRAELALKKERLMGIGEARTYAVSERVQAVMRDYQTAGFQWMCLLDEMGWGGCLADDMGLGKTLQTISFLQHLVEQYPSETHLVVCPTSLLYNWEGELKKFVPGLDWHIHYGVDRELDDSIFERAHVIITSYGMVRSDIEHLAKRRFGYVILDESQAIKNPASQVRKAVQQLQARNRLALSGTPVQNNTFDLYAQMDFLNPGMLGSQEFFRSEFANPIDRSGDKEAAARLRKLVYPFILRRTKEQVAKDLPDKTEMILWCEMGAEQRKIYNSFKEHYRESLLEKISEEGMAKSSIYILEGLTKLRQICDSSVLVGAEYPNESVKLEELVREIEEGTGQHKCLVFSQFTSMLGLIREALDGVGVSYSYLDGAVSAEGRRKAVEQFQNDPSIRVFLISLKAGGVGLTLTAADYVYLVDPWWNPAAEQQAIDRSYRIGQKNKVFAYRMICKDTVEEKILQLQEKKRSLAADLVADETGFVKQLSKDEVAFLFE